MHGYNLGAPVTKQKKVRPQLEDPLASYKRIQKNIFNWSFSTNLDASNYTLNNIYFLLS